MLETPREIALQRQVEDLKLENAFLRRQMQPPISVVMAEDLTNPVSFGNAHMPHTFRSFVEAMTHRMEDGGWNFYGRSMAGAPSPFIQFRAFTSDLSVLRPDGVIEHLAACHRRVCHQLADFIYQRKERVR